MSAFSGKHWRWGGELKTARGRDTDGFNVHDLYLLLLQVEGQSLQSDARLPAALKAEDQHNNNKTQFTTTRWNMKNPEELKGLIYKWVSYRNNNKNNKWLNKQISETFDLCRQDEDLLQFKLTCSLLQSLRMTFRTCRTDTEPSEQRVGSYQNVHSLCLSHLLSQTSPPPLHWASPPAADTTAALMEGGMMEV